MSTTYNLEKLSERIRALEDGQTIRCTYYTKPGYLDFKYDDIYTNTSSILSDWFLTWTIIPQTRTVYRWAYGDGNLAIAVTDNFFASEEELKSICSWRRSDVWYQRLDHTAREGEY